MPETNTSAEIPDGGRRASGAGRGSRSPSGSRDPWTARIALISGVVVVAILVVMGVIVANVLSPPKTPRTVQERDVMLAEQNVRVARSDAQAWFALASAYIAADKFSDAEKAIRSVESLTKRAMGPILRGDLAVAKGDDKAAKAYYKKALSQSIADHESDIQEAGKRGQPAQSVGASRVSIECYIALGKIDARGEDHKSAVANFSSALRLNPTLADVQAMLGDSLAAMGRKQDAEAAYNKALSYIPNYQPALDGLKRVQEGR